MKTISDGAIYDYNVTLGWGIPASVTDMNSGSMMSCSGTLYVVEGSAAAAFDRAGTVFSYDTSNFSVSSGNGGSILPEGGYLVPKPMLQAGTYEHTFTITADPGCRIASLTADGAEVAEAAGKTSYEYTYRFNSASEKITVTFETDPDYTGGGEDTQQRVAATEVIEGAYVGQLPEDVFTAVPARGAATDKYFNSTGITTGLFYAADGKVYKEVVSSIGRQEIQFLNKAEVINYFYENQNLVYGKDYDLIRLYNYYEDIASGPSTGVTQLYTAYLYKEADASAANSAVIALGSYEDRASGSSAAEYITNHAGIYIQAASDTSPDRAAVTADTTKTSMTVTDYTVSSYARATGPSEAGNFYGLGSAILADGGTTDANAVGKAELTLVNPTIDGLVNTIYATCGGRINILGGYMFGCSSGAHGPYVSYRGEFFINTQDHKELVTIGQRADGATMLIGQTDESELTPLARPSTDVAWMAKTDSGEKKGESTNTEEDVTVIITGDEAGTALATDSGGGTIVANRVVTKTYGLRCAGVYSIGADKGMVFLYNSSLVSYLDAGLVSASGGYIYAYNCDIQGVMGIKTREKQESGNYAEVRVVNSKVSAVYDEEEMIRAYDVAQPSDWDPSILDQLESGSTSISELNIFVDKANNPKFYEESLDWWFTDKSATPGYSGGNRFAVIYTENSPTPVYVENTYLVNKNYELYKDAPVPANNYIISSEGAGDGVVHFINENSRTHWDLLDQENSETCEIVGDFYIAQDVTSDAPGMGSGPSTLTVHFQNSEWEGTVQGYAYNAYLYFDKDSSWKVTEDTTVGTIEAEDISKITADAPVTVLFRQSDSIQEGTYGNVTFVKYYSRYFSDLEGYGDAIDAVDGLADSGIVRGTGDGLFQPDNTMNYGDFALMLMRAADAADENATKTGTMAWAMENGVGIAGKAERQALTVGEVYDMLYRGLNMLNISADESLPQKEALQELGAFDPTANEGDTATRAQSAVLLSKVLENQPVMGGGMMPPDFMMGDSGMGGGDPGGSPPPA